jgi:uncharacterized ferritin-like protein (DUF455 family)
MSSLPSITELRHRARAIWQAPNLLQKQELLMGTPIEETANCSQEPGRPEQPRLVHPSAVARRGFGTLAGRAALVHAVAHIEFNAINLAADAVWRFDGMPDAFYADWWRVAQEEAQHFMLLNTHLEGLETLPDGSPRWRYGSFDAHNGLWEMCARTAHDVTARMALVPRLLEARGLDATPQIQAKLRGVPAPDAQRTVEILDVILRDEIGHVAIGNHWYRWLCAQQGLQPVAHFRSLLRQYQAPKIPGPYNQTARLQAGFTPEEMAEIAML